MTNRFPWRRNGMLPNLAVKKAISAESLNAERQTEGIVSEKSIHRVQERKWV